MNYEHFSTILNNYDRKAKRNELSKMGGQFSKAFNFFVLASIEFYYQAGNKQINIINDLFVIANHTKGMNASRLAAYLKSVVPHELAEGDNKKGIAPKFFGPKTGDYLSYSEVCEFVTKHPQWALYGRNDKSTQFDELATVSTFVKVMLKNGVPMGRIMNEISDEMTKQALAS